MITVFSNRYESSAQGTFSVWSMPDLGFACHCIELPWKRNRNSVSCIPAGTYIVRIRKSPKYGLIYHVKDVTGRTFILIHPGNYAGDIRRGYKSHSMGCLLLGKKRGWLSSQKAVLNSRITIRKFMNLMDNQEFKLIISDNYKKQAA